MIDPLHPSSIRLSQDAPEAELVAAAARGNGTRSNSDA